MEQATPPVKVSAPNGIRIDWANHHPYIEVWDGGHLVIAGWVYGDPNMIDPAAKEPTAGNHTILTEVQAGLVKPPEKWLDSLPLPGLRLVPDPNQRISTVPEPCLDACEGMDYEDKDINTKGRPPVDRPPTPAQNLLNIFGGHDT